MNAYVASLLDRYLSRILSGEGVTIPDDHEEMNWRIFFAHSQDIQGFRADIFTGGPNEEKHPSDPSFIALRPRWGRDSRSLIEDLASLWEDKEIQQEMRRISNPFRSKEEKAQGIQPGLDILLRSDRPGARVFAETLTDLKGARIARKTNALIRSYIQNAYLLQKNDSFFRTYLQNAASGVTFPPGDIIAAEKAWIASIQKDFYNIGPALAPYMICDWLLWLWREGRIAWFCSYKPDSVHLAAVAAGLLPEEAARDFAAYCKTLRISEGFGAVSGKPCPPRILNECIWLDGNKSTPNR